MGSEIPLPTGVGPGYFLLLRFFFANYMQKRLSLVDIFVTSLHNVVAAIYRGGEIAPSRLPPWIRHCWCAPHITLSGIHCSICLFWKPLALCSGRDRHFRSNLRRCQQQVMGMRRYARRTTTRFLRRLVQLQVSPMTFLYRRKRWRRKPLMT